MGNNLHSVIGASSMYRWSKCPGSVRLSAGIKSVSSSYAAEGNRAHEVASAILENKTIPADTPPEMLEAVQVYVKAVLDDLPKIKHKDDKFLVEHKFDLSAICEGMFGTADCVAYDAAKKLLRVYDYKHGAGIAVDVVEQGEKNSQLMFYGLGALMSTNLPCETVELVIVQPRCPHPDGPVRRFQFKAVELLFFAEDVAIFASRTKERNAPLVPGDHCRFCPAAGICKAIETRAVEAAKVEFSAVLPYEPEELSKILTWLPTLEAWATNVREFAYREALHGNAIPGWKLVNKVPRRKWKSETAAETFIRENLPKEVVADCFTKPELISAPQVEKLVGKKAFKSFAELVSAESSGLTLVEETDSRPVAKADVLTEFTPVPTET